MTEEAERGKTTSLTRLGKIDKPFFLHIVMQILSALLNFLKQAGKIIKLQ